MQRGSRVRWCYLQQRGSCRVRKIKFNLTFREWKTWWLKQLGPDWLKKRGRKRGQYVMARMGDKGPYAIENIKCIAHSENCKERKLNKTTIYGEKHPNHKITEAQARYIKLSPKLGIQLAKQFGLDKSTISQIKNGQRWSYL